MARHNGEAPEGRRVDQRKLFLYALGLTLTLVAWGLLVWLAIDFGTEARNGEPLAWGLLVVATIGATGCLFLTLTLGSRTLAVLRGERIDPKPRRAPRGVAGKRAAR